MGLWQCAHDSIEVCPTAPSKRTAQLEQQNVRPCRSTMLVWSAISVSQLEQLACGTEARACRAGATVALRLLAGVTAELHCRPTGLPLVCRPRE
jgi:hypothetical protein